MVRYIFIDIETANQQLDFEIDKADLIEIGAFDANTGQSFQSFVHLDYSLSEFTQRLTGIRDSDLNNAPSGEKVLGDFLKFIGDRRDVVLVGHNIEGFDIPVLQRYDERFGQFKYLDTLQLFLLLYPGLSQYNVEYLYKTLFDNQEYKEQHRALQDAKEEAELFDRFLNYDAIKSYRDRNKSGSLNFFHLLWQKNIKNLSTNGSTLFQNTKNLLQIQNQWTDIMNNNIIYQRVDVLLGKEIDDTDYSSGLNLKKEKVCRDFFKFVVDYDALKKKRMNGEAYQDKVLLNDVDLRLAYRQCLGAKEPRNEQWQVIVNLAKVFNEDISEKVSGIEAGTGTGKTYGYLIPSMLFLDKNPQYKVFVSTYTKLLQSQLMEKDMPEIAQHFPKVKYVHLKANSEGIDLNHTPMVSRNIHLYTIMLRNWIAHGYLYWSEIPYYIVKNLDAHKFLYDSSKLEQIKNDYNKIFGFKGKLLDNMVNNNLFVVNHNFMIAQMSEGLKDTLSGMVHKQESSDNREESPFRYFALFDEGHNLEEVTREYYSITYDFKILQNLLSVLDTQQSSDTSEDAQYPFFIRDFRAQRKEWFSKKIKNPELKDEDFKQRLAEYRAEQDKKLFELIHNLQLESYWKKLEMNFPISDLARLAIKEIENLRTKYDLDLCQFEKKQLFKYYFNDPHNDFLLFLSKLKECVGIQYKYIEEAFEESKQVYEREYKEPMEISNLWQERLLHLGRYLSKAINFLKTGEVEGFFVEGEVGIDVNYEIQNFGFKMIPKNLWDPTEKRTSFLTKSEKSCLLSATLFYPQTNISYVLNELVGENCAYAFPVIASLFNYEKQRKIEIKEKFTADVPNLSFLKQKIAIEKVTQYQGRTLILTTNNNDKDEVAKVLFDHFNSQGIMVLKHESGTVNTKGNQQKIKALIDNPRTVLVGSKSYMEGVDIAGDNLSLVLLWKLPFLPPRPWIHYQNNKPVYRRQHPQFVYHFLCGLVFKQAIGRLIRTEKDTGEVLILDARILDQFGQFFQDFY